MMVLVGIGGSLGAMARFWLSGLLPSGAGSNSRPFPVGTWVVNLGGSFLLGFLAKLYTDNLIPEWFWHFAGAGFCGAFTTFSTFGYETISLLKAKRVKTAAVYVLSSLAGGIAAAWAGFSVPDDILNG